MKTLRQRLKTIDLFLISFLIFKICYIIFEFSFNAQLVDIAASNVTLEELHGLEFFGRSISSIATYFFFVRILYYFKATHSKKIAIAVLGLLLIPIVFFGQKLLIQKIVDHSTGMQRRQALLLSFIPLAVRHATIQGFNFDSLQSPEAKTFLAECGAILYFNKYTYETIENQIDNLILGELIEGVGEAAWNKYCNAAKDVHDEYYKYQNVIREIEKIRLEALKNLKILIASAAQMWLAQRDGLDKITSKEYIDSAYSDLQYYFANKSKPKVQSKYNKLMLDKFGGQVDDNYWCSKTHCPISKEFLRERIRRLAVERAISATRLDPTDGFRIDSKMLADFIRMKVSSSGIVLSEDWRATDEKKFIEATLKKYAASDTKDGGHSVQKPPETYPKKISNFEEFESLEEIQGVFKSTINSSINDSLKDLVGKGAGVEEFKPKQAYSFLWNRSTFENTILLPRLKHYIEFFKEKNIGNALTYENNGVRAEVGINSMKKLIIPVLSLTLSSFVGIINSSEFKV